MIVLDTHALIWWVSEPSRLSSAAKEAVDEGAGSGALYVSCISAWEIATLVERGRLRLSLDVRDWLCRCESLPFLSFVAVTNAIFVEAVRLPDFPHQDPADRIIAATALHLGARVVTRDDRLRSYPHLKTVW